MTVGKVRTLIREHHLAAAVPTPGAGQQVPAELVIDREIVKGVPGLLTLFADGGWDDREKLTWLFTADDSLRAARSTPCVEPRLRGQTAGASARAVISPRFHWVPE